MNLLPLLLAAAWARPKEALTDDWAPSDADAIAKVCRRYDRVTGELYIGPNYTAEDLRPLRCLREVGRGIRVEGAPNLRSLSGVEALRSPAGVPWVHLSVEANPVLTQVDALNAIPDLRIQSLSVRNNPALRRLSLQVELVSGGELVISGNRALESVSGLSGGPAGVKVRSVELSANPQLRAADGLAKVVAVDRLTIAGAPSLESLALLPDLRSGQDLLLRGLPALRALSLAPALEQTARLSFADLDALDRLPAWPNLTHIGALSVTDNAALVSIDGLLSNRSGPPIVDQLTIEDNPSLPASAVEGLPRRLRTRPEAARLQRNGG